MAKLGIQAGGRNDIVRAEPFVAGFHVMSHILQSWPRRDAAQALAWWHHRTLPALMRDMCSDWGAGNLVLASDDWRLDKPTRRVANDEVRPVHVETMKLADEDVILANRVAFEKIMQQPTELRPKELHRSRKLDAFRRVFDEVARHMATGHRRQKAPDVVVYDPGVDPLHCPVDGCNAVARLVQAQRGQGFVEEVVCLANASHRGPPLRNHGLHQANDNFGPACSYCASRRTRWIKNHADFLHIDGVRAFFYKCQECEELTVLPLQWNPSQRMVWLEQGTYVESFNKALEQNGWRPMAFQEPRLVKRRGLSEVELELHRIDQLLAKTDHPSLRGHRGPELSAQAARLRMRMLDDALHGRKERPHFYTLWAQKYLGHGEGKASQLAHYNLKILRRHGVDVVALSKRNLESYRRILRKWIREDVDAGRGVRTRREYIRRLSREFPAYEGKGPEMLVSRELDRIGHVKRRGSTGP